MDLREGLKTLIAKFRERAAVEVPHSVGEKKMIAIFVKWRVLEREVSRVIFVMVAKSPARYRKKRSR